MQCSGQTRRDVTDTTRSTTPMSSPPPCGFTRSLSINHENTTFQCHLVDFQATSSSSTTLVVLIHGAGCTSSSWCMAAQEMADIFSNSNPSIDANVTVAAFDMRGHGDTVSSDTKCRPNLSLAKLVEDAVVVTNATIDSLELDSSTLRVILVGHSLGGAIVVRASAAGTIKSEVVGVVVVDLVEGSALASLPHLPTLLANRPDTFESIEEGIKWSLEARMVNNPSSALHSVPPMLKETEEGIKWRTNLHETSEWWEEWYMNLSKDFLALPTRTSKLLILASTDSLDKELMIGQMQGKFQFQVVDSAGHSVHEDQPKMFSSLLWRFLLRVTGGAVQIGKIQQPQSSSRMFETFAKK